MAQTPMPIHTREAGRYDLCIASISVWEVQILHAKGRLELPLPFAEWLTRATERSVVRTLPLDRDMVIAVDGLPGSFHGAAIRPIASSSPRRALMRCPLPAAMRRFAEVVWSARGGARIMAPSAIARRARPPRPRRLSCSRDRRTGTDAARPHDEADPRTPESAAQNSEIAPSDEAQLRLEHEVDALRSACRARHV